jgi:hypothetical protein
MDGHRAPGDRFLHLHLLLLRPDLRPGPPLPVPNDRSRFEDGIPMVAMRVQPRLLGFLGIGFLMILLPACHSPGGIRGPSSNVVYRPANEGPGTKPLYVSGYAGANYGSLNPRRPLVTTPAPVQYVGSPSLTIKEGTWDPD